MSLDVKDHCVEKKGEQKTEEINCTMGREDVGWEA